VIHHYKQDVAEEIKRLTNRRGVGVVIEHVGEAAWPKSVRSLARGGRLVTCGATTGPTGSFDLAALFSKQPTIHGSYMGTKGELKRAARLFFRGSTDAYRRSLPSAGRRGGSAAALGRIGPVRQDRA